MGTLKIEIDLPEFEKELNLNITIMRDGEVLLTSSSPEVIKKETKKKDLTIGEDKKDSQKKIAPEKKSSSIGGNLMGMEL